MTVTTHAALTLIAALVVAWRAQHDFRKPRAMVSVNAAVVLAAAPITSAGLSACRAKPSPVLRMAARSIGSQPLLARIVDVRRRHELALTRIGGLYGP